MGVAGQRLSGHCLCGAVRFSATIAKDEADVCHCGMCRRWAGGIAMQTEVKDLHFEDRGALGVYHASDYGERLFCTRCGSSLAWRMRDGSFENVAVAAFDPPVDLPLKTEIFVDEQPTGYAFAGKTHRMTAAEVMAAFAGDVAEGHNEAKPS